MPRSAGTVAVDPPKVLRGADVVGKLAALGEEYEAKLAILKKQEAELAHITTTRRLDAFKREVDLRSAGKTQADLANDLEYSLAKQEADMATAEFLRNQKDINRLADDYRVLGRKMILDSVDKSDTVSLTADSPFGPSDGRARSVEHGVRFINGLLSQKAALDSDSVPFVKGGRGRASCDADGQKINLTAHADSSTVVHELGHWIEAHSPSIRQKVHQFLERRTAGEKTISMSRAARDAGLLGSYNKAERTRVDRFINPYMGKDYVWGGRRVATEILSMGLQMFYSEPHRLAAKDPEYFSFIYDTVRALD